MERLEEREFKIPVLCEGNECVRCSRKLKDGLEGVKGVAEARLDPVGSVLTLSYDANIVSFEALEKRAKALGCALSEQFGHETYTLTGLDCADCAVKLEAAVGRLPGMVWASANFAAAKLSVEYEADKLDPSRIIKTVKNLGYGVLEARAPAEELSWWQRHNRTLSTAISGLFLASGLVASYAGASTAAANIFYALSIALGGWFVAKSGAYSIKSRTLDMNFLVMVAVIGAMLLGEWVEGAAVIFLFAVGNALEAASMERTRRVLRGLVELAPREADVRQGDHVFRKLVEEIAVGDIVQVKPGEKIAMDGCVVAGRSAVDQSSVTGESMPVEKAEGDTVFAATINQQGALDIQVTKSVADNTISKIIHMVEQAQTHKAPTQLFTERFGRYYTPVVMAAALFTAVVPPLVIGAGFTAWLERALILLVVACPCALIISTPVALVSSIGNAARNGVLVKGGVYMEAAASIDIFAFDKTGTLTVGEPEVTDIVSLNGWDEEKILRHAWAVEARSEHPIARAVGLTAKKRGLRPLEATDFQSIPGSGAYASIGGSRYYVGSWRLFEERQLPLAAKPGIFELEKEGKTIVLLANEDELIGALALADRIREETPAALADIRRAGVGRLIMLTGDNEPTAALIAERLGIDAFHAGLLPEDKLELIKALGKRYGNVAMVGDGVNDAPALASATVGIAMGAAGTDVALETADIALMADDVTKIPYTIELSRRTMRVIKQNIVFSLVVVAALILTTFGGYLSLPLGIIGHEGSALLVILNGMRLLR